VFDPFFPRTTRVLDGLDFLLEMTVNSNYTSARTRRLTAMAGAVIAGALTLSACSAGESSSTESSASSTSVAAEATFNAADVTFAQGMLPHHEQAVEMAQLTDGRTTNAQVLDLAARIEAAQGPEIETLTGWLGDWGADGEDSGMSGMDHSGMDMGGMMSDEDMTSLENASGTDFDRMWLEMMIEHHTGAVGMAETEISDGEDTDAIAMAKDIRSSQNDEIQEMEQLLSALPQA
jgi:uncharacterized protein (DUF305 family)